MVACRPHKAETGFESHACTQGGDLIRKHRVGCAEQIPLPPIWGGWR